VTLQHSGLVCSAAHRGLDGNPVCRNDTPRTATALDVRVFEQRLRAWQQLHAWQQIAPRGGNCAFIVSREHA
jgi:hypothetical protein